MHLFRIRIRVSWWRMQVFSRWKITLIRSLKKSKKCTNSANQRSRCVDWWTDIKIPNTSELAEARSSDWEYNWGISKKNVWWDLIERRICFRPAQLGSSGRITSWISRWLWRRVSLRRFVKDLKSIWWRVLRYRDGLGCLGGIQWLGRCRQ